MVKLFFIVATVLMCLASAKCTNSKFVKTIPTITNSLVNLGKMEVSFYLNGKHPEDPLKTDSASPLENLPITRSHAMETPCPCSAFKSPKETFLPNPSDLIDKILRNKDLFKDPTSAHCCESHEQMQESTIFVDLSPYRAPMTINNLKNPFNSMKISNPFQRLFNSPSGLFGGPIKPKGMEIMLFPKRKDIASMDVLKLATTPVVPKVEIQVVGDKEIKPLNEGASVKKDLTSLLEKHEPVENVDELKVEEPAVTNVNNAL